MEVVIPGQRLGSTSEYSSGDGTYVYNDYIYSKLAGVKRFASENKTENGKPSVSVHLPTDASKQVMPDTGTIVTCRVLSISPRFARVSILSVNGTSLVDPFRGLVRREDVRATEIDKVEIHKSFRPGDIILARVLSLGDAQSYLLSTAENELGVIYATSEAGAAMIPHNWCQMLCTKTRALEFRKVAKVRLAGE